MASEQINRPRTDKERKVAKYSRIGCAGVVIGLIVLVATCDLPEPPEGSSSGEQTQRELTEEEVASRIGADAISSYSEADRANYPRLFEKLGDRVFEVEGLGRKAAGLALQNGECDRVLYVDVSERSTRDELQFFVECNNETRVRVSETQFAEGEVDSSETREERQSRVASRNARDEHLISEAKDDVRAVLRDPSSADFGNVFVSDKDGLVTCGFVNARNGFGGMSGQQPFIAFSNRIAAPSDADFKDLWEGHCAL
ncbi:hypothetical protein [uncultured Erythrobacter sp.]|uniref:hypothetical protein n=1 Tax=uncultured Erythrobacter sp. TaxID=263913 RepID=UPI0026218334|nr:hypothetical protein [uncultured Erythrobacter sp.]